MSYVHSGMPPVIRRTADGHYQLESQGGTIIAEYNRPAMEHPGDWWSDMIDAMKSAHSSEIDAIHDLTLLTVKQDWEYVDDR